MADENLAKQVSDHEVRIRSLEVTNASMTEQIKSLCLQVKSLVTTLRWFIGLLIGSFVGFFFYAVKVKIF